MDIFAKLKNLIIIALHLHFYILMIKAVFFDLDDTLYDYEYAHQKALTALFFRIHKITSMSTDLIAILFSIAQKEVKMQLIWTAASHNRDLYLQKFFEKMNMKCKNTILPDKIVTLYDLYWTHFYATIKKEVWSKRTLKYLQEKLIKTWIITDCITYTQLKKLEKLWLSEYTDIFISSEEAGVEKPHSGPFLLACHKAGVLASEAMMVWDNIERDIDGSQWIGMKWIRINRHNKKSKWIHPCYTVHSTKELYKLIKSIL